jgi:FKBP-type peptidyl-prolyl cis-trans isomerase SlyD
MNYVEDATDAGRNNSTFEKFLFMMIDKHAVVSLGYSLKTRTGLSLEENHVETTDRNNPFVFLFAAGMLLPDFENNIKGKKQGDTFDFFIPADKGYGLKNDKHIVTIPIDAFKKPDGTIDLNEVRVGNTLSMSDNEGRHLQGKILEITAAHVKMDFNHPLAGHELHFTGEIFNVRLATPEEISHGHVHGPGGHHH